MQVEIIEENKKQNSLTFAVKGTNTAFVNLLRSFAMQYINFFYINRF